MIEVLNPKNEAEWQALRTMDVTSTESPALYGCSPYSTRFELWHRKKAREIIALEPSERMRWGLRLQGAIAAGVAEDQGWKLRPMTEYMRDTDTRMGASFDFAVGDEGILEVKNVDGLAYREGWLADGDSIEAPPHIELQVQHQLAVSGRKWSAIAALVGGNRVVLLKREPVPSIIDSLRQNVANFWDSIARGDEPRPDFTHDASFIAKLYAQSVKGKVLDVTRDPDVSFLAAEHARLGAEEKRAKEERDAIKAKLLLKLGDAEKAVGDGFSIMASTVAGGPVSYDREPYRSFRVYFKKKASA